VRWGNLGLAYADCGTALTLTGADADHCLVGEYLPGVGLQLQSLAQRTGGLPLVDIGDLASSTPRWALNRFRVVLFTQLLLGLRLY